MKIERINEEPKSSGAPPYFQDFCPVCKEKANSGCRCASFNGISNDRGCKNGHEWYWDNGKVIIGSHHKNQNK